MLKAQCQALQPYLKPTYTREQVQEILDLLSEKGTFQFEPLPNGLFPAALALQDDQAYTGYSNAWVRDNVLVAYGLFATGDQTKAVYCLQGLAKYFWKYKHRFENIISDAADKSDPMQRPHIRINASRMEENEQAWAHAQNDALGYFLWLYCKLIRKKQISVEQVETGLFPLFIQYLHKIRYWEDEDNGHWEEEIKIEASSIGTATAGLLELSHLLDEFPALQKKAALSCETFDLLEASITRGRNSLYQILPSECIQPHPRKKREYDAALLFLIEPLEIVDGAMADRIIQDIKNQLLGPFGIRRYLGDSYWCADYKEKLAPEQRTNDFSQEQEKRDALLKPGQEAQWCIFDPILSVYYGKKYRTTKDSADREAQIEHFNRSLAQVTGENSAFGPFRCPESYYLEQGTYVPNDITPLLWTQANLLMAIHAMLKTATPASLATHSV